MNDNLDLPPLPPPVDVVIGADGSLLDGYMLDYTYSSGRRYRLVFTAETVTFTMLDAPDYRPEFARPITVPYLARAIRDGLILVHWMVPDRSGHVAMTIDLTARTLLVAALMPGKMEFFDSATIHDATRHGAGVIR